MSLGIKHNILSKNISPEELRIIGYAAEIFSLERMIWRGWKFDNPVNTRYSIYKHGEHIWVIVFDVTEAKYILIHSDNLFSTYNEKHIMDYNARYNKILGFNEILKEMNYDIQSQFKTLLIKESLQSRL